MMRPMQQELSSYRIQGGVLWGSGQERGAGETCAFS